MKQHIIRAVCPIFLTVLAGLAIASCDLIRKPSASLPLEEALETYDDAVRWNRGIYTQFRNRQGGVFVTIQEQMADYLSPSAEYGNRGGTHYSWNEMNSSDGDVATVYSYYYSTLKNVNSVLDGGYQRVIDIIEAQKQSATNEQTIASYNQQIDEVTSFFGSAYFARAYYYFNLLYRFGTPYKAETASSDYGVPVVTTFQVSDLIKRGTVQEGYDRIFKDLSEAEKYLADVPNTPGSMTFNTDAVTALRARAYLEMKDYSKAYAEAYKLISSGRYPLVQPTPDAFTDMWRNDSSSEFILVLPLARGTESVSSFGSYYGASASYTYHKPDWFPAQELLDKYAENDLRKAVYFEDGEQVYYNNIFFEGVTLIAKYKGNPAFATQESEYYGPVPNGQALPKIFRIAETYLIAAEAAYFSGQDALTPLNALRVSRGLDPLTGISGDALLQEIKNERLRELAFEGFRLFDLRRWGDPMNRMTAQTDDKGSSLFLSNTNYKDLRIEAGHPRFTFPIPEWDISVYGEDNMPQNPGW